MNNKKHQDDIFTISLPKSEIIFTRYLYIKDEVKIALMINILQKNNDAIFWAYELLYSGFKHELFELFWKIYYDFFATINPSFEAYLLKKHLEFVISNTDKSDKSDKSDKIISAIVQDLIIRPFNTDIFFLRKINELFEIECIYHTKEIKTNIELHSNLKNWIDNKDYRSISKFILNKKVNFDLIDIYMIVLDILKIKKTSRLLKELDISINSNSNSNNDINQKIMILSKIISKISNKNKNIKGKNFYIRVDPEEIIQYETINVIDQIRHYNILKSACICGIDEHKHLGLFKLQRQQYELNDIENMYRYNWEYHASFSPIWFERYKEFGGVIDYTKQKLNFKDDDKMEEFYKQYGYEPDEQPLSVQYKSIMKIESEKTWTWFNNTYMNNGLFKLNEYELCELSNIEY